MHLHPAAEADAACIFLQFVQRTGAGEGLGVERGVADLAICRDAGRQRETGARPDVILAGRSQPVAFRV